jgi:YD repeat-containing protein
LLLSTTWSGAVTCSVSRTYNNNFNIASHSVNGANAVNYTYDDDGLLTSAGTLSLTRDASNGLLASTNLASISTTYIYNAYAELGQFKTNTSLGTIFQTDYVRDDLGRIEKKTENVYGTSFIYDYTYDDTGRLTEVKKNSALQSTYTYDDNGNR